MGHTLLKLHGNIVLYPEQLKTIEQLLDTLVEKLPARLAVLTQVSGPMIAFRVASGGRVATFDPHALGALIAGDLAASREIARVTGTYEERQLVLRQGQQSHIWIAEVGNEFALLVQANGQTPLGWARMVTLETAQRLARAAQPNPLPTADPSVPNDTLTDLVNDSLDSIWTEASDVH